MNVGSRYHTLVAPSICSWTYVDISRQPHKSVHPFLAEPSRRRACCCRAWLCLRSLGRWLCAGLLQYVSEEALSEGVTCVGPPPAPGLTGRTAPACSLTATHQSHRRAKVSRTKRTELRSRVQPPTNRTSHPRQALWVRSPLLAEAHGLAPPHSRMLARILDRLSFGPSGLLSSPTIMA